ncbi:hypothetical protein BDF14DRAFT_1883474 [Spinellus fusiger]|nr:hypothetical protein BDF14DRAFT_1883474 [Spinellus fusiger]
MPAGFCHEIIVQVSRAALWSFFSEIRVEDVHNVPREGPLIVAATHHNMVVDPAVLSVGFPYKRRLHYWAKNSLFKNPYARRFLLDCGVVPVDRTTKNNAQLYAATFDVLRLGETVAVFPEGTSHTLSRLGQFKDGVSFAALEYNKLIANAPPNAEGVRPQPADILPVGIVYPQKSKYRSAAIIRYGKPLSVQPHMALYHQDPKAAAKALTLEIEKAIEQLTVNAMDWETRDAAEVLRWLLFPGEDIMEDYIDLTQSLITALTEHAKHTPDIARLQESLRVYKLELTALSLTDAHIAHYTERDITPFATTVRLLRRAAASLIDLPLFLPGLVAHLPLYVAGYCGGKFEVYEEVRAQNKIFFGLLLVPLIYLGSFVWAWSLLSEHTFLGFLLTLATLGVFVWYHVASVDEKYAHWKDLVERWRLFDAVVLGRGMWRRKQRVLELKTLRDYQVVHVRQWVAAHRSEPDLARVWAALHARVCRLQGAKSHKKREQLQQYKWCYED